MSDQAEESYQLFKTDLCGFCYRVRGFLEQHGIEVPLKDVNQDPDAFRELLSATSRTTVPCLRIQRGDQVEWMFESMDIIRYLAGRYNIA
ncbi:MAG: glutathione S-transferase N-terminal domain-containing protein [Pseudomonadota bacterium]